VSLADHESPKRLKFGELLGDVGSSPPNTPSSPMMGPFRTAAMVTTRSSTCAKW